MHTKYYNDIRIPYDTFVKKAIVYANPTSETKHIRIQSSSPNIKIKQ
jgi:hypothetical protein